MMSERIKEPYYSLMYRASQGWNDHLFQVPPELLEKFAELIVQECIKEIEFLYEGGSDRPIDDGWDRAIECASSMVKYRFGVEE